MTESNLRVGLEASYWSQPTTGTGQYLRALWTELSGGAHGVEPVLLVPGRLRGVDDVPAGAPAVVVEPPAFFPSGHGRKLWWELVGVPQAARRARVDIVHVPYFAALPRDRRPYVVTVHDLVPLVMPVYARSRAMRLYLGLARRLASRASLVLTDSVCSARDIVELLPIQPGRVHVVPLAAGPSCARMAPDHPSVQAVRQRFKLDGPIVFNVGGLDVRKNIDLLIRAFARALPELPTGATLVIAGAPHSKQTAVYPDLAAVARAFGVSDRVTFTGRVSETEKVALLNVATVYAYPSLYEGFGLSPLEAMQCGTPVLVANRSSLPEVVGDGGLLIEPDEQAFSSALARLLNDPVERDALAERGLARARDFSWSATARLTAATYRAARDMAAS